MMKQLSIYRAWHSLREEIVTGHPAAVRMFAMVWLGFIAMEVIKNLFFITATFSLWLLLALLARACYQFLPWFGFSLLIGVLLREGQHAAGNQRESLIFHCAAAAILASTHILILTSAYWIFSPALVARVSFSFVLMEQLLKWMHFELLGYAAIMLYWRRILPITAPAEGKQSPGRLKEKQDGELVEEPALSTQSILLNSDEGTSRVPVAEIHWLTADDNYVIVNGSFGSIRVRSTLKALLRRLPEDRFRQTHRSAAVNLSQIANVNSLRITLRTGARLPISRRRHKPLLASLEEFGFTC